MMPNILIFVSHVTGISREDQVLLRVVLEHVFASILEQAQTDVVGTTTPRPADLHAQVSQPFMHVPSAGNAIIFVVFFSLLPSPHPSSCPHPRTARYALAKRAQVTLTELWAERPLSSSGRVCFNSMHPGWCDTPAMATGMSGFYEKQQSSMRSSEQGADTIVWLVSVAHSCSVLCLVLFVCTTATVQSESTCVLLRVFFLGCECKLNRGVGCWGRLLCGL